MLYLEIKSWYDYAKSGYIHEQHYLSNNSLRHHNKSTLSFLTTDLSNHVDSRNCFADACCFNGLR